MRYEGKVLEYIGQTADEWHDVRDGNKNYSISVRATNDWNDPNNTGVAVIKLIRKTGFDRWVPVTDPKLRRQILACAWPMYLE